MNERDIERISSIDEVTSKGNETDRAIILAYAQGLTQGKKIGKREAEKEKEDAKEQTK